MAIGIFGGTFNPPHVGHLRLVRAFADALHLTRVLIIPTFIPPHKESPDLASGALRMEMCRRLFAEERFIVSDMELARGGKSYTVETLEALHKLYPGETFYLLVGSDMLQSFDTWYRAEDIRKLCTVCAASREKGVQLDSSEALLLPDYEPIELSSTQIREKVRLGEAVTEDVGTETEALILRENLYADAYTAYRRLLRQKLGDYRLHHSFCVADSAKALAQQYGGDPEQAYLAGLLHDIMKDTPKADMLRFMQKAGVRLTNAELHNPKLWHAMAGEAYLRTELSVADSDLLNAVRYHTTGRGKMSLLEKILYIADYISADRVYDGVEKMRTLSAQSLEDAMLFGLSFTIGDLAEKGQIIHPDSVDCYNMICIQIHEKG